MTQHKTEHKTEDERKKKMITTFEKNWNLDRFLAKFVGGGAEEARRARPSYKPQHKTRHKTLG